MSDIDVEALFEAAKREKAARAEQMPTTDDALKVMFNAYQRLSDLGWRDAIYCPKDGSVFPAIEAGSTGIHRCHYSGEWPDGGWSIESVGDVWPSRPILFHTDHPITDESQEAIDSWQRTLKNMATDA